MTLEEKKVKLRAFCEREDNCIECSLYNKVKCDLLDNDFTIPDGDVDKALELAYPDEYKPPEARPSIKDSGARREFETGAVRDIQEGKGRCDLMPLDVLERYYGHITNVPQVFNLLSLFEQDGDYGHLISLLRYISDFWHNDASYDLLADASTMFLEVAKHFEEGAKKYGEYNWQKGIPTHCYIDSAVRHYLKYLRGDKDEPHDRAFCWNILCCIWTCIHKPELNDYAKKENT